MHYIIEVPKLSPNNRVLYKKKVEVFEAEVVKIEDYSYYKNDVDIVRFNVNQVYTLNRKNKLTKKPNDSSIQAVVKKGTMDNAYPNSHYHICSSLEEAIALKSSLVLDELEKFDTRYRLTRKQLTKNMLDEDHLKRLKE